MPHREASYRTMHTPRNAEHTIGDRIQMQTPSEIPSQLNQQLAQIPHQYLPSRMIAYMCVLPGSAHRIHVVYHPAPHLDFFRTLPDLSPPRLVYWGTTANFLVELVKNVSSDDINVI